MKIAKANIDRVKVLLYWSPPGARIFFEDLTIGSTEVLTLDSGLAKIPANNTVALCHTLINITHTNILRKWEKERERERVIERERQR